MNNFSIKNKKNDMKIFEYNEAKQVVVCGDIHGAFETMVLGNRMNELITLLGEGHEKDG